MRIFLCLVLIIAARFHVQAQPLSEKKDTVIIDSKSIHTSALKEGTSRYLVYFKTGPEAPRSNVQFWTITTTFEKYYGREAVVITQQWEDQDSTFHRVTSISDRKTFAPLYQKSWWKQQGTSEFDFVNNLASVNGIPLTDSDSVKMRKRVWMAFKKATGQFALNWHIDLQTFSTFLYKENVTFLVPFYDPGSMPPRNEIYKVEGSGELLGYNDSKIDCWLLTHTINGMKETFWVSKKTKEVLKLDHYLGNDKWRYKVKLPVID